MHDYQSMLYAEVQWQEGSFLHDKDVGVVRDLTLVSTFSVLTRTETQVHVHKFLYDGVSPFLHLCSDHACVHHAWVHAWVL